MLSTTDNTSALPISEQSNPNTKNSDTATDKIKNTILLIIRPTLSIIIFVFLIFSINFSDDRPNNNPKAVNENPANTVLPGKVHHNPYFTVPLHSVSHLPLYHNRNPASQTLKVINEVL